MPAAMTTQANLNWRVDEVFMVVIIFASNGPSLMGYELPEFQGWITTLKVRDVHPLECRLHGPSCLTEVGGTTARPLAALDRAGYPPVGSVLRDS